MLSSWSEFDIFLVKLLHILVNENTHLQADSPRLQWVSDVSSFLALELPHLYDNTDYS